MHAALLAVLLVEPAVVSSDCCGGGCVHQTFSRFFGSWYQYPQYYEPSPNRYLHLAGAHHGNYYDRPYGYRQVEQQSRDGVRMGENSQSPYANQIFLRRYSQRPEATPDNLTDPEPIPADPRPLRGIPRAGGPSPGLGGPISFR